MNDSQIQSALSEIFREVFEGVKPGVSGTWLVEKNEGIFDAIETVSPAEASTKLQGQHSTVGSHVRHLNHYLSLFNATVRKESPSANWVESWSVTEFSHDDWERLTHEVRAQFRFAYEWYQSAVLGDPEQTTYAVANIAHAAYHLGAIRALVPLVESTNRLRR